METDDVSHEARWLQVFNQQKAALQAASLRKREPPKDRKSLEQLVHEHFRFQMQIRVMEQQPFRQQMIHQAFVAPPYPPSVAPLASLTKGYLKDLRLETHHRGSYLLLRTVTPAHTMTAVLTIMEDENGDGVLFQLYQQQDDQYRKAQDILPRNSVWIVREPYFKGTTDGGYGLRVDHISDVIPLKCDDPRVPASWQPHVSELVEDPVALKGDGNGHLKAGKIYEAVECYTRALEHSQTAEQHRVIQLNRSLANLRLGCYDKALEDALGEAQDGSSEKSEKGLYRAARSLYELGRFQECHDTFAKLLQCFPGSAEAPKELFKMGIRLREQDQGEYDFKTLIIQARETPPLIECARYIGPLTLGASEGRGRGFFTTKDVQAGDLLLCEKAFAYCYANAEGGSTERLSVLMNASTNRITFGTQGDLITKIVQKLKQNPSLMPALTALHTGGYSKVDITEVDGLPVIDTFLIERIINLNAFGSPRTSLESHEALLRNKAVNEEAKAYHTTGLFLNASYINHSCYSNVRRSFIGDTMIVRACRNISAGTEITFWYQSPDSTAPYAKIQEKFEHWGFECTCAICKDRKTTRKQILAKRTALLKDLEGTFDAQPSVDFAKIERTLAAIEKTYSKPAAVVPRLILWDPYLFLTRMYSARKEQGKVVRTALKVLESLGFVLQSYNGPNCTFKVEQWGLMKDCVIEAFVHLWVAYADLAHELCAEARECARTAYRVCIGEDETFDGLYGKMARQAIEGTKELVEALQGMAL